jgi:hypothetical protein
VTNCSGIHAFADWAGLAGRAQTAKRTSIQEAHRAIGEVNERHMLPRRFLEARPGRKSIPPPLLDDF